MCVDTGVSWRSTVEACGSSSRRWKFRGVQDLRRVLRERGHVKEPLWEGLACPYQTPPPDAKLIR